MSVSGPGFCGGGKVLEQWVVGGPAAQAVRYCQAVTDLPEIFLPHTVCHRAVMEWQTGTTVIQQSQHYQHSTLSTLTIILTSDITTYFQASKNENGINSVNAQ